MMKQAFRALCAIFLAGPVGAQDMPSFDASVTYADRDAVTEGVEGGGTQISRLTVGYTYSALDGKMRLGAELGGPADGFDGAWGAEADFARRVGNQRFAIGARVRGAEDLTTTTELIYGLEHFGEAIHLRGNLGLQGVADDDALSNRAQASGFLLGEAGLWLGDDWVLTAGLQGDSDGALYTLGTEYHPDGWPVSLFIDYGAAADDYRGSSDYADVSGGIRFVPSRLSLKSFRRGTLQRIFYRPVEVQ